MNQSLREVQYKNLEEGRVDQVKEMKAELRSFGYEEECNRYLFTGYQTCTIRLKHMDPRRKRYKMGRPMSFKI